MFAVRVQITEWIDDCQPGFVKCLLCDAWGRSWSFVEKVPIVSAADLWNDSPFPQPGLIGCVVIRRWSDDRGRQVVTIDTNQPWGVEGEGGQTQFDVLADQLEESTDG